MELPSRGNLLCFIMLSVVVTFIESKLISFTESGITKSTQHHIVLYTSMCQPSSHCDATTYTIFDLYTVFAFAYSICIDSINLRCTT